MKWGVLGALVPGANHPGWFGACIFKYAGPNSYDCAHGGATVLDPINHGSKKGNANAGLNIEYAEAFDDANGDGYKNDDSSQTYETTQFRLLRESTWSSSFDASPEPRRAGKKLSPNAQFTVADWDTAQFAPVDATATLQFRKTKSDSWRAVKKVKVLPSGTEPLCRSRTDGAAPVRLSTGDCPVAGDISWGVVRSRLPSRFRPAERRPCPGCGRRRLRRAGRAARSAQSGE